jgi:transposase
MGGDCGACTGGAARRQAAPGVVARVGQRILYMLRGGQAWRLLPHDFPPWQTVYYHLRRWQAEGVWERIHHAVLMADRERAGREASPTAAIIDSQSVRTRDQKGALAAMTQARRSRGASGTS